jgi:Ca-activated chloride channel family protein
MMLAMPWAFLLLLPVGWHAWRRLRRRPAHGFGSLAAGLAAGRSWRQRWTWLPPVLHTAGLIALVCALARPQAKVDLVRQEQEGIAIELLLDVSSSMDASMEISGEVSNRLQAAKQVLRDFVLGNGRNLPGRPRDLIGLVTFARYADTVCPMTLNHQALAAIIEDVQPGTRPNEDGTAYGDATALAAARLKAFDETQNKNAANRPPIRTKVIVMLTDGENNAGEHLPLQAAALAKQWGIRIYTIMIGTSYSIGPAANVATSPPSPVEQTLFQMAQMTGGVFRHVFDFESLDSVYREIDQLEKSRIATVRYVDQKDLFEWFALPALAFFAIEQLLAFFVLRSVP